MAAAPIFGGPTMDPTVPAGSIPVWKAAWVANTPRAAIARSPSSELMKPAGVVAA